MNISETSAGCSGDNGKKSVVVGVDPGPEVSAFVAWDGSRAVHAQDAVPNETLAAFLNAAVVAFGDTVVAVEVPSLRGAIYQDVVRTVFWAGRFYQAAACGGARALEVNHRDHALHNAGNMKAVKNLRDCLIERCGPPSTKETQERVHKKTGAPLRPVEVSVPGPTHGVKGHAWDALSVSVYAFDTVMGTKK